MSESRPDESLPPCIRELTWEHDPGAVRWPRDERWLIERVLGHGSLEAIRWIRVRCSNDELRSVLRETRGRRLGPRQLRLWQVVLELPEHEVDDWLKDEARRIWERRTA